MSRHAEGRAVEVVRSTRQRFMVQITGEFIDGVPEIDLINLEGTQDDATLLAILDEAMATVDDPDAERYDGIRGSHRKGDL